MHVPDLDRIDRIGMPEAVLCSPKSIAQLEVIVADLVEHGRSTLFTRLSSEAFAELSPDAQRALDFDPDSETAVLGESLPPRTGHVAIVVAGTSDLPVAAEAEQTLAFSGVTTTCFPDVGVAGLWRLEARIDEIRETDVVIAVAGMDAALISVIGGLVAAPVIGVPTSVGYGVAEGGGTALNSALASCAQGVAVVNIDNGFGAACAALRILGSQASGQR
ncbi:MAG: nickel pincer cofactor biosynthesis protein LarB [Actinomycetota bacterium]